MNKREFFKTVIGVTGAAALAKIGISVDLELPVTAASQPSVSTTQLSALMRETLERNLRVAQKQNSEIFSAFMRQDRPQRINKR